MRPLERGPDGARRYRGRALPGLRFQPIMFAPLAACWLRIMRMVIAKEARPIKMLRVMVWFRSWVRVGAVPVRRPERRGLLR